MLNTLIAIVVTTMELMKEPVKEQSSEENVIRTLVAIVTCG